MTYYQFGILLKKEPNIYDHIECVLCDEIHNLIKYRNKFDTEEEQIYTAVINKLIQMSSYVDIICLTATPDALKYSEMRKDYDFVEFNLTDKEIRSYTEEKRIGFNNWKNQLPQILTECDFENNRKTMIYTDKISTANEMVEMCGGVGLKAIGLWSMNNANNIMNDEQKEVRKLILEEGLIPDNIDVLIINASYETGINIKNKNIDVVIVNSTDKDTLIQSRNRIRCDIPTLFYKSQDIVDKIRINLDEKKLNQPLTKDDKKKLCEELNLVDTCGRKLNWKGIKIKIEQSGYLVKEIVSSFKDDNGKWKQTKASIIIKK